MDASLVWLSPETLQAVKIGLGVIGVISVVFLGSLIVTDLKQSRKRK